MLFSVFHIRLSYLRSLLETLFYVLDIISILLNFPAPESFLSNYVICILACDILVKRV